MVVREKSLGIVTTFSSLHEVSIGMYLCFVSFVGFSVAITPQ